jgi:autophagy-related protein 16
MAGKKKKIIRQRVTHSHIYLMNPANPIFIANWGTYSIRRLTESNTFLARKNQEMTEVVNEKNVTIQVIQDELTTLQLEMSKLDERQRDLERENAQLLQRWLKKMNEEADKMNAGNAFLEKQVSN